MKILLGVLVLCGCGGGDADRAFLDSCVAHGKTIAEIECGPGSFVGAGCKPTDDPDLVECLVTAKCRTAPIIHHCLRRAP